MVFSQKLNNHRMLKELAKAQIRLRICAGRYEALLVAHTKLLEISCTGSLMLNRNEFPYIDIVLTFKPGHDKTNIMTTVD